MAAKDFTAFIFARGGSKGVKNKNIRLVGGKPLIAHSIASALESSHIGRVIVSTDSEDIAAAAKAHGADVLMRPDEMASDTAPEILAWRHAIESSKDVFKEGGQEIFLSCPATSPFRAPQDIDAGIERFQKGDCDIVFGITPSDSNPYLTMVTIGDDDLVHICIEGSKAVRRQDVPSVYDITSCVYVTSPDYVRNCERLIDGRVGYVEIPNERAIDIDTEYDLYLADLMLTHPFEGKA